MWLENEVFRADLESILNCPAVPWDRLREKTVFVTGATGLIGSSLVSALLYANRRDSANIRVLALARDLERAKEKFHAQLEEGGALRFISGRVEEMPEIAEPIDYIVHGAGPTASAYFARHPVETAMTILKGTEQALEMARQKKVRGFVCLSSMEVYGAPQTDEAIDELYPTAVDTMSVRSVYPLAKQMSENLCADYASEYGVPAMAVRLAQTFGPGVAPEDDRVFAQFARAAIRGETILLRTAGESEQTYLYTADAVTAILTVLLRGSAGEVYNAANANAYCSIREMAGMVANTVADGNIQVKTHVGKDSGLLYPPPHKLHLSADKLCRLGWEPAVELPDMYARLLAAWGR